MSPDRRAELRRAVLELRLLRHRLAELLERLADRDRENHR